MIGLRLGEVAAATDGRIDPGPLTLPEAAELLVDGPVVTDSRLAAAGGLYVARIGEQADGHDFVADAAGRGAVAALTSRPVPELPAVVVEDVQVGLGRLARAVLDRATDITVVAVTGSSGKTSTKDLLAQVLTGLGATVAAEGSYNSEVGAPLTVLRIDEDTRYLVVEMGSRGLGHLTYLTGIAPPDLAVVLNVGSAHLGEFGSRETIAAAKSELVQGLSPDGVAVLNADDPAVAAMAAQTRGRVVLVGRSLDAVVRAERVELDDQARASFDLISAVPGAEGNAPVRLGLHGEHHVANALAVAGVALCVGLSVEDTAAALSRATPASRWRMEVSDRDDGVTVVNDAYNANPESMQAALTALVAMAGDRRAWAVLGEMRELGSASDEEHATLGRRAAQLGIARLVVVGEGARAVYDAGRTLTGWEAMPVLVNDIDEAFALLSEELAPGDIVLVKSSRDSGLRVLGDRLSDQVTGRPTTAGGPTT